jgi:Holliday junction resolvase-like predicted endonuclease
MLNELARKVLWDLALKRPLNKNELETLGVMDDNPALIVSAALQNGLQLDEILKILTWHNFELIVAGIYELNNFYTIRNFHFTTKNGKNEIDVIAIKDQYAHIIECKHWLRTRISSNITHIVEHHLARMISFKDIAQKVFTQLTPNKSEIILIPVIIVPPKNIPEIVSGIPVVTLYKLQDFINRFEDYIDEIKHVRIMLSRL